MLGIVEWYEAAKIKSDQRVENWFLMSSFRPIFIILVLYLYICTSAGPRLMMTRKPYTLKKTLILYNFVQVALSMYMVYEGLLIAWLTGFNLRCQTVDFSDNPLALRMARTMHFYFICKLIELLDTVFFVLRKKDRQITFLHLYHHTSMVLFIWLGVKFSPGGQLHVILVLNSFVHVIMYIYYMLAAMGPMFQKYLWWKRHITKLQIIQSTIFMLHNGQALFTDCKYSKVYSFAQFMHSVVLTFMFGSFYIENYMREPAAKSRKEGNAVSERKLN